MLRSACSLLRGVVLRAQLNEEKVGWGWAVGGNCGDLTEFGRELDQPAIGKRAESRHLHGVAWVSGSMGAGARGVDRRRNFGSSTEAGGDADGVKEGGSTTLKNVGFIGLGNMGARMASNLLSAGFRLVVHDRNVAAVDEMKAKGALEGRDPEEVASQSDVVITMLPSSPNVEDVYLGPSGILRSTHGYSNVRPVLLIDASTIDPMTTKKVAAAVQRSKLADESKYLDSRWHHPLLLDTPVSGGIVGAEKATLTFMVGGETVALDAARPFLSAMGKSIVHCGSTGSGQVAKLCNNLALAIEMAAVAEALALGQKLGVDLRVLSGIFNTSSARCWSSDTYNPVPGVLENIPASRGYGGGFATRLMVKDISLALAAGKEAGAVIPLGAKVLELYTRMIDGGASSKDFSAIYEHIYGGAGVSPAPKTSPDSSQAGHPAPIASDR
ncbi:3-hydroxyisobutyrate dehydrogenase-related protein [Klebsormidium nitens]|uniref:3-hydroxyisobutyrate dehydrogenase n=1 Tax=Klebsormidium nitens TaxID=105231 RepID=A0A1Y1I0C9_KLENI|nr:3-hydroxyisobutyrate dehydrogenase-related protein [Klebsormidium nitens]|eukprot:GAQ83903.1 3-hydroxyisobutyrate dehydrogenase-related protein [Klebsormidium nitens]